MFPELDEGEEMIDANQRAESDLQNVNKQKLLEAAEKQAIQIIGGLIKNIDRDVKVEFEFIENTEEMIEENEKNK